MEFWIGLSVGMHLGRVIAEYLEKIADAYGLLPPETASRITELEQAGEKLGAIIDEVGTVD
jgi:hypothetical protein